MTNKAVEGLNRLSGRELRRIFQKRAANAVLSAVKRGLLARITPDTKCADCGKPAQAYDHRDYAEPLVVTAVCDSCNLRRGPARLDVAKVLAELAKDSAEFFVDGHCTRHPGEKVPLVSFCPSCRASFGGSKLSPAQLERNRNARRKKS